MEKFRLKKNGHKFPLGGGKGFISNTDMTDEKAILFLSQNPARVKLFSKCPEDWQSLKESKQVDLEDSIKEIETEAEELEVEDPISKLRRELKSTSMTVLREEYSEIPTKFGQKKNEFIKKIIKSKYPQHED
tara:strand:+ start:452 stop:847 length:396 start_codon:yes stop_codon:yes gene_type:complete